MSAADAQLIRAHHALRGVAALLVLLFHFRDATLSIGDAVDARTAFFSTGFIWVDFFFMLSGFILSHVYGAALAAGQGVAQREAVWRFYLARLARIYPLHLATLLGMIALELSARAFRPEIADAFTSEHKDAWSVVKHLTLTHAWWTMDGLAWNVPSWSISTEAFAYLLFPLLLPLLHHRSWAVRALLPVLALAIYAHTFMNFPDVEDQQPLLRCVAGFITGMLVYLAWRAQGGLLGRVAGGVQVAAVVVAVTSLHWGWSQALVLLAFAALIIATADDRGPIARLLAWGPLLWLGTLSYSLYMTHWIFYRAYWMYGDRVFSGLASQYSPANVYALKVISLVALTVLLSYLTYRLIELPGRTYLKRWLAR